MNELLQKIIDTAPFYQSFLQQDIAISVSDTEKYLLILDTDTLKFPSKVGDRVDDAGYKPVLDMISKTRKPFINVVPREMTGTVPVKAVVSPIIDKNEIVGYFSVSINMDKNDKIEHASENLTQSLEETNRSIHSISESAKELSSMMGSIENSTIEADENVKLGNEAITLITGIAKQSNLLGLNAAIEASLVNYSKQ